MTNASTSNLRPYEKRFQDSRKQYAEHLRTTECLQAQLRAHAEELAVEDGWDTATQEGVSAWIEDSACIFRFFKRNGYDEKKTHNVLLTALSNRATHSLHQPLPSIPPYSTTQLFYILPLPHFTDKLGRPIVILTAKEVKRDSHGSMHDLAQWIWWGAEMLRRTLRDHWVNGRWNDGKVKGEGGEGCVLLIDAGGSSYRNLEVELVPIFNLIGSKNFPGMIESAFVINAGWVQRSLWSILRPILPRPAVERISLVDKNKDMGEVFDLDRLPQAFGGRDPWKYSPENNPILAHYQSHKLVPESRIEDVQPIQPGSSPSPFSSTAEVFYTANNTPVSSRRSSRRSSRIGPRPLGMTALEPAPDLQTEPPSPVHDSATSSPHPSSQPSLLSRVSSSSTIFRSAIARVNILPDFHLYLSPSRLAQVDALSDEVDDVVPTPLEIPGPVRRTLRPAFLHLPPPLLGTAITPSRPPLRILGIPARLNEPLNARSYSNDLVRHHVQGLVGLDSDAVLARTKSSLAVDAPPASESSADPTGGDLPQSPDPAPSPLSPSQTIPALSRSSNPWYGYPALLISSTTTGQSSIVPRYPRRRKRDLVRTLLFLFLVRLQTWRNSLERSLGLNRVVPFRPRKPPDASNPAEGLLLEAEADAETRKRGAMVKRRWDGDWIWIGIVFMIMRGAWTRLIAAPLEAIGLGPWRDLLGLV